MLPHRTAVGRTRRIKATIPTSNSLYVIAALRRLQVTKEHSSTTPCSKAQIIQQYLKFSLMLTAAALRPAQK